MAKFNVYRTYPTLRKLTRESITRTKALILQDLLTYAFPAHRFCVFPDDRKPTDFLTKENTAPPALLL